MNTSWKEDTEDIKNAIIPLQQQVEGKPRWQKMFTPMLCCWSCSSQEPDRKINIELSAAISY